MPSNAATKDIPATPSWFDVKVGWAATLPGMPSFVSLAWIERWHGLDLAALRRLHAAVMKSRDALVVGAWWPQASPTLSDVPFLLARTMREPAAFAELVRAYAMGGMRPASPPATLLVKLRETYVAADQGGKDDIFESILFADLLEDPAEAEAYFVRCPTGKEGHHIALMYVEDPLVASLLSWMRVHFPGSAATIDDRLAWTPEGATGPAAAESAEAGEADDAAAALEQVPGGDAGAAPETGAVPPRRALPEAAPLAEGEAVEIARDVHAALAEVGRYALLASEAETPRRAAVHPVVLAALRAARGVRTLERYLDQPSDVSGILASLAESNARVATASKGEPGHVPAPPFLVARPAYPRLDALAKELHGSSSDIHGLFESALAKSRTMAETSNFDMAPDIAAIGLQIKAQAAEFMTGLRNAVAEFEAARYVAPVRAPRAPDRAPAESTPGPAPKAAVAPARAAATQAPSAKPAPSHPVEVLASAVFDLGAYDEKAFKAAMALCMPYLADDDGLELPEDPVHNPVFSATGAAGQTVRAVLVGGGASKTWSAIRHQDHADHAGRRVALEITLHAAEGNLRLGIRVSASAASGNFEGERFLPTLAGDIAARLPCKSGPLPLSAKPLELTVENARETFESYVLSPRRTLPVVAISLDKARKSNLVDIADLATALAGVAHVLVIPTDPGKVITTAYAHAWSVYNGAVRIYQPKVNTETDDAKRHTIFRADEIFRANANREDGDAPFERHLVDLVLRESTYRYAESGIPAFDQVEAQAAEAASRLAEELSEAGEDVGLAEIYASEAEIANRRASEAQAFADHLAEEAHKLKDEVDDVWARNANLVARVESLTAALAQRGAGNAPPPPPAAPATVEDICRFAETDMGSHVTVVSKAIRETRKTTNLNVARLHDGLVLLRDFYVPFRRGEITREAFDTAAKKLRYEETACFSDPNTGRFNGYTAELNGTKYKLDRHLKFGNATSTDIALRIYFHYDEGTQSVIVGHMPSHLPNNLTN